MSKVLRTVHIKFKRSLLCCACYLFCLVAGTIPWLFEQWEQGKETPGTIFTGFLVSTLRKGLDQEGVHSFSKQRLRASCVPGSPGAAVTKLQSPSLGRLMPQGGSWLSFTHSSLQSVGRLLPHSPGSPRAGFMLGSRGAGLGARQGARKAEVL